MINIDYNLRERFKDDSVHKVFRISFPNGEYPDLVNDQIVSETVSFTESLCSQNQLKLGLCEANQLTFECADIGNINGAIIEAFIEIEPENMDYHNEKFYVDDMEVKAGIIGTDIALDSSFAYTEQQALDGVEVFVEAYHWINTWKQSYITLTRNGSSTTLTPSHPDSYPLDVLYSVDGYRYVVAPVLNETTHMYTWYLWQLSNLSVTSGTDGEPPEPDPGGEAVDWGTWYRYRYILTAVPFTQFKHRNVLAISYGRYKVESSKRNTADFQRRQVVAYEDTFAGTSAQSNYSYGLCDIERMKMECLMKKNSTYGVDAWKFMIANFNMASMIRQGELTSVTPSSTRTVVYDFMELWRNTRDNFGGYKIEFEVTQYRLYFSKYTQNWLDPSCLYYLEYEYDRRIDKYLGNVYDHIIDLYGEQGSLKPTSTSYTYNYRATKDEFIKSAKQRIAMNYSHVDGTTNKSNIVPSDNVITTLEHDTNVVYPWCDGLFCDANGNPVNVYSELIVPITIKVLIYDKYTPGYSPHVLYPTSTDPYYTPQDIRANFNVWKSDLDDCDAEIHGDRSRVTRTYLSKKVKGYTAEAFEEELLNNSGQKLRSYLQSMIEMEGKFGRQDRQTYEFELYSLRTMFHTIYPHDIDETYIRLSEAENPTTHAYEQIKPDDWNTNFLDYYIRVVDEEGGTITYVQNRSMSWQPLYHDYYRYNPNAQLYPAQPYVNDREADTLYPQGPVENIYASNYSKLWYDDFKTKKFGKIICKYKESADSNDTDIVSYWFNGYTEQHYYELQYVQPVDWIDNYTNYYTYSAENYTLQTSKPSNWTRRYYMYYIKDSNDEYVRVEGVRSGKKIKAPKWKTNTYYFRGKYELTHVKPSDWDDDWDSYYTYDSKRNRYKSVGGDNAPTWVDNKYWRVTVNSYDPIPQGSGAPEWEVYKYYTQQDLVGDDYLTYDLSQNALIQDYPWVSSDIQEILEVIAYELEEVQYYPTEMTMIGLPYLEAGDTIQIITPNDSFSTIILRRTLKGIQALHDTIEAR